MTASPLESPARPPASLTEWLRGRSDADLAELLRRRPDLALPAPADLPTLAGRLSVRTSVQRAVDGLDAFGLRVLEALVLCAGAGRHGPRSTTRPHCSGRATCGDALAELRSLALVWGADEHLHLTGSVRESIGAYPAGLGRPAAVLLRQVPDAQLAPVLRSLGLPPASQPKAGAAIAEVLADPDRVAAPDRRQRPAAARHPRPARRRSAGRACSRARPGETPPAVLLTDARPARPDRGDRPSSCPARSGWRCATRRSAPSTRSRRSCA